MTTILQKAKIAWEKELGFPLTADDMLAWAVDTLADALPG